MNCKTVKRHGETLKCMLLSEIGQSGMAMYCERAITAFWKWGNYRDRKETRGCQGKGYRINGRITEDFKSSETTLYDTVVVDTCHYTFVKTQRMLALRVM